MADESHSPSDPIASAYAARLLAGITEETYAEVIKGVSATEGTLEDKIKTAFNSGVNYAGEVAFGEFAGIGDRAMDAISAALKGIDGFMETLTPQQVSVLSPFRNILADFVNDNAVNESAEEKAQSILSFYGVDEEYVKKGPSVLDDDETLLRVLYQIAERHPHGFVAYCTFRENPNIPCKCVGHTMAAWMQLSSLQQAVCIGSVMSRYPAQADESKKLAAEFAKWWLSFAHSNYETAKREGDDELPPRVSEAESRLHYASVMNAVMKKGA